MSTLTSAYNAATTGFINYTSLIPKNTLTVTAKSFGISFTLGTMFSANPIQGAICGTLGATAALVSALVSPLFDQRRALSDIEAFLRSGLSMTVAGTVGLVAFGTAQHIHNLTGIVFFNLALRYIFDIKESPISATLSIYA